jgi:ribose/xylose/arabinose/galactoside ABC-type transport system permease subunit
MSDSTGSDSTVSEADQETITRSSRDRFERLLRRREVGVLFAFLILFGLIGVTRPELFLSWNKISSIVARLLRQISSYLIIGIGMTYLIISGEFDLSVGSMYAIGAIVFSYLVVDYRLLISVSVVLVLFVGVAVGLTNGVLVTKVGVPSLITTIGMLSLLRGLALYLTPGGSRSVPDLSLITVFGGTLVVPTIKLGGIVIVPGTLEIAYSVFWALGLLIVFAFLLNRTVFGYHVYATGDDSEAAEMTGINTDRVKIINFVLTSVLASFAGILSISYFGTLFATAGQGFELLIIAGVIIGGTNLFGGEGSLLGTFLGSLVIGVIPVLLVINSFPASLTELFTGVVIIVAVALDILIRR